jgi:protein TonB
MSASDLDPWLPDRSFVSWFSEIIGPKAGVVWQLTECGERSLGTGETGPDMPACAEVNANLPDGRKVFVVISVGTFKQGMIGKPALFRAVIEQNERFYQVRRLSDLPRMLRAPDSLSETGAKIQIADMKKRIAELPAITMNSAWNIAPFPHLAPPSSSVPHVKADLSQAEAPPAAPPAAAEPSTQALDPAAPPAAVEPSTQVLEQVPESVSQSRATTKVKPVYPPTAKKMNATGTVEVEITISEAGLVVEATAISGHLALRSAAVDAARKWVFNPAILNGAPVRVKSVLTFVFAPSAK